MKHFRLMVQEYLGSGSGLPGIFRVDLILTKTQQLVQPLVYCIVRVLGLDDDQLHFTGPTYPEALSSNPKPKALTFKP